MHKRRRPTRTRAPRAKFVTAAEETTATDELIPKTIEQAIADDTGQGCTLWFMSLLNADEPGITIGLLTSSPLAMGEHLADFRTKFLKPEIRFIIAAVAFPPSWFPRFSRETLEFLAVEKRELPLDNDKIKQLLEHIRRDIPEVTSLVGTPIKAWQSTQVH